MRWKYIENIRYPSERAHAYQISKTCEALTQLGEEISLVVPDRRTVIQQDPCTYYRLNARFLVQKLPVFDALAYAPAFLAPMAYALERVTFRRSLRRNLTNDSTDILYTRDPHLLPTLMRHQKETILELHDLSGRKKEILATLVSSLSRFICISAGLRDEVVALGVPSDRVHVAPDGYEPRDFASQTPREEVRKLWGVPNDALVVLYAGGLYPWKGHDFVIQNWPSVPGNAYLIIIGGPQAEYERLRDSLHKQPASRVKAFPQMPHEEVVKLFSGADLGLLPTSPDNVVGRLYTSPLKLFEYLAGGLPVLASDVPTSREILTDEVAKFFTHDQDHFLRVMSNLLHDRDWIRAASVKAHELVQQYSWMKRTQNILNWLRQTRAK